jgi:hypothetical protein
LGFDVEDVKRKFYAAIKVTAFLAYRTSTSSRTTDLLFARVGHAAAVARFTTIQATTFDVY